VGRGDRPIAFVGPFSGDRPPRVRPINQQHRHRKRCRRGHRFLTGVKAEVFDDLVPQILDRVQIGAVTLTQVIGGLTAYPDTTFAAARIKRERELAAARYLRDRDLAALELMMARLDAEEAEAKASTQVIEPVEALAWLRDLPALWAAADGSGRRLLTEALFEKVEVLGVQSVTIHPTPEADAHGWSDAFGSVPLLLNPDPPMARTDLAVGTRKQVPF
jgi:hypothetical protein